VLLDPDPGLNAEFVESHPELLDKQLLLRFYSPAVLSSPAARACWVAPDLNPIPGAPPSQPAVAMACHQPADGAP
jgi:hypothetical protein